MLAKRRERKARVSTTALLPALALLVPTLVLSGCGGDAAGSAGWGGTVDTLEGGAPVVSNPADGFWDSASAWRVTEEVRIGSLEGDGPDVFGSVAGLAVDDLGRTHVLDRQAREVRVFGPDGAHVRTFGREGEGPGELGDPIGLVRGPEGRMWVVDPSNNRYSVFDTAGTFVTSHRRQLGGYAVPWSGGFDDRGRLLEATVASGEDGVRRIFVRFDTAFSTADTLESPPHEGESFELETENSYMAATVPFTGGRVTTLDPGGTVWTGVNEDYAFARVSLAGDTMRVVRKDFEPAPVTHEDRDEALERLDWFRSQGGEVDPSRIPDTKPAYRWLAASPSGHLWVAPVVEEADVGSVLDIFDPEGRYLGRVDLPVTLTGRTLVFRDDQIYGLTTDELDVSYVVRLRVERATGD